MTPATVAASLNAGMISSVRIREQHTDYHRCRSTGQPFGRTNSSYETYRTYIERRPAEVVANIIICLIHQTNFLLDQQIRQLEHAFVKEGGLRERMTRARLAERGEHRR